MCLQTGVCLRLVPRLHRKSTPNVQRCALIRTGAQEGRAPKIHDRILFFVKIRRRRTPTPAAYHMRYVLLTNTLPKPQSGRAPDISPGASAAPRASPPPHGPHDRLATYTPSTGGAQDLQEAFHALRDISLVIFTPDITQNTSLNLYLGSQIFV